MTNSKVEGTVIKWFDGKDYIIVKGEDGKWILVPIKE